MTQSAGIRLRNATAQERPAQVVGAINAYCAMLAERVGFKALYLSGAGVANASFGLPDLGITALDNVLEDARRITAATDLPLLVDADTGFGSAFNIARTVKEMIRAGVAGVHIEDQVQAKRCGHRPGKAIVPKDEMVDRIKAAVERAVGCREAGADMIFPEAMTELAQYRRFADAVGVPILANITEFGKTPLFTTQELRDAGVGLALYPLSAFRAMSKAAEAVYAAIRRDGTQAKVVATMQTRAELYDVLDYHSYEQKLDRLFAASKPEET